MRCFFYGLLLLFLAVSTGNAAEGITFRDAWTAVYAEGAAREYHIYGIMMNLTPKDDVLVGAETPIAQEVIFKKMISKLDKGEESQENVASFFVPAEQIILYDHHRFYIMLKNPKKALNVGDSFPLTLIFRDYGKVKVMVDVKRCCD